MNKIKLSKNDKNIPTKNMKLNLHLDNINKFLT